MVIAHKLLVGTGLSIIVSIAYADWNTFRDPSDGVAFRYPKTWTVEAQITGDFRVKVGDPVGTGSCMLGTKTFPPNLSKMSADEVVKKTTKQDIINGWRFTTGTDLVIYEFESTKVSNRPAIYYVGGYDYQSLSAPIQIRSVNVMTKVNDKLYTLTCTSLPADIEINKAMYRSILSSLYIRY